MRRTQDITAAAVDLHEETLRLSRLRRFLRLLFTFTAVFEAFYAVAAALVHTPWIVASAIDVGALLLVLAFAWWAAQRGRRVLAASLTGYGLLGVVLFGAPLLPPSIPAQVLIPVLALAAVLPYLEGRPLIILAAASFLVEVALAVVSVVTPPHDVLPPTASAVVLVSSVVAGAYLILTLLLQFGSSLRQSLAKMRAAQTRTEEAQYWLESLLNVVPFPLLLVEPGSARLMFVNRAAEKMAGGSNEGTYYKRYRCTDADGNVIDDEELPEIRAARGQQLRAFQMDWHHPSGRKSLLINSEFLPAGHGHPDSVLIAFDEITQQKDVQAELQKAVRVRDEFLSIASHELRTPLTALQLNIIGVVRSAEKGLETLPPRVSIRLNKAVTQAERLAGLIDSLLDVSRIQSGRLQLEVSEVDIVQEVREVMERFRDQPGARALKLVAPGPVVGQWDRLRLDQVVTNLVSNAVKYGQDQPIEVLVDATQTHARLVVADQGIGIPPESLQRVFGRFERAVSEKNYGGFGLGLWIARQLVEAMGGTIGVESQPGSGSTFTVQLPRVSSFVP